MDAHPADRIDLRGVCLTGAAGRRALVAPGVSRAARTARSATEVTRGIGLERVAAVLGAEVVRFTVMLGGQRLARSTFIPHT